MKYSQGKHSYGGYIEFVGGTKGKITIGKYCSIGADVRALMSHDHNIKNISSFPFGHPGMDISKLMKKPLPTRDIYNIRRKLEINIGNDVFIGSNSVIFRDVNIGDGAVIGAFSVITKDVSPYSIVAGNNRYFKKRFSKEDIEFLLELKWWDFSDEKVAEIGHILCSSDIEALRSWAREKNV